MMIFMSAEDSKFFAETRDAACTSQRWTGYQDISSRFHIFIGDGRSATSPIHEILLVGSLSHTGTIVRLIIEGRIIGIGGSLAVEFGGDQIPDHSGLLSQHLSFIKWHARVRPVDRFPPSQWPQCLVIELFVLTKSRVKPLGRMIYSNFIRIFQHLNHHPNRPWHVIFWQTWSHS